MSHEPVKADFTRKKVRKATGYAKFNFERGRRVFLILSDFLAVYSLAPLEESSPQSVLRTFLAECSRASGSIRERLVAVSCLCLGLRILDVGTRGDSRRWLAERSRYRPMDSVLLHADTRHAAARGYARVFAHGQMFLCSLCVSKVVWVSCGRVYVHLLCLVV